MAEEERASGREAATSIRLAGEFHIMLAEMTGNTLLARYVNEVVSRCSLILALYGRPHSSECGVSEHRQVLEALASGDAERASGMMAEHLKAITSRALIDGSDQDPRDILASYAREEGLTL